jgi:hypothetical protein
MLDTIDEERLERLRREMLTLMDARWEGHHKIHEQQAEAVSVAVGSMNKRLDAMNEIRASLADQGRLMITRAEVETMIKALNARADENRNRNELLEQRLNASIAAATDLARSEGRPGHDLQVGQRAIVAALGVVAVILTILGAIIALRGGV